MNDNQHILGAFKIHFPVIYRVKRLVNGNKVALLQASLKLGESLGEIALYAMKSFSINNL